MKPSFTTKIVLIASIFLSCFAHSQLQIDLAPINTGQTFNTCNGFIIDSGGQGGPGYSDNETTVITICPDIPGGIVYVTFNLFALDLTDDNPLPAITNVDVMNVYDGTTTGAPLIGSYTGTQLQGVTLNPSLANVSGCLTFEFISNTIGTGMFTGSVTCVPPCQDPIAGGIIIGGITSDSIRTCIGSLVNFQDFGSQAQPGFTLVNYTWDFMDGGTAAGTNVFHAYTVPGEYRVQLFVTDDNGCGNPNLIDLTVLVGTEPDFSTFPSDTTICIGEGLVLTAIPDDYEVEWTGFIGSQSIDDGCLTDNLIGVAQEVDLLQTGFSAGSIITNVTDIQSICFDLEHSFMGDLVITIECPNGQSAILHQQGGGGTQLGIPNPLDNVDCSDPSTLGTPFTYCFTSTAPDTWVEWVNNNPGAGTLPAGSYEPIEPLSNLIGCPTNGVWTLSVVDNWAADDGTLFNFSLNLDPSFYPVVSTFEPQIGLGLDSSYWVNPAAFQTSLSGDGDVLTILPTSSGTYNYQYIVIDNFGCTHDTSVNVNVNPNPIVFAGNDTTLCGGNLVQLLGEISGPGATSLCEYSLILEDTFGDSWNGNTITVTVNGVPTTYTLAVGNLETFVISFPSGANVTVTFNANGAFIDECFFSLVDEGGTTVLTQGPMLNGTTTDNIIPNCPPDFVFDWTSPINLDDPTILDPLATLAASETFTLAVYPVGHPLCVVTDEVTITISPIPDAGVDAVASFCPTAVPSDLFPLLGPTADPTGTWQDPSGNPVNMPYNPVTMPVGDYLYIVNLNGCIDSALVNVSHVITEISTITPTNISCFGETDGSINFTGINFFQYTVNGGAPLLASSPVTIFGLAAGAYLIEVISNQGCTDSELVNIIEPPVLAMTLNTVDANCYGVCDGQVEVLPTGGTLPYTYVWNQGVVGDQTGNATTVCAGFYSVDVVDFMGCRVDMYYTIDQPDNVQPTLLPDTIAGCYPHQVDFLNTTISNDVVTTLVDFGDGSSASYVGIPDFEHTYAYPGSYTVTMTVTTTNGCEYIQVYDNWITAHNHPNANFLVSPDFVSMIKPEVNLINQSSGDATVFDWVIDFGTPGTASTENVLNVTYPEDKPGSYSVVLYVESAVGCTDSIEKFVTIVNDVILYAPNTFTPDNDEHNQNWSFHITGIDIYDFSVRLFNRWGEVIWESHDATVGWDGTYRGQVVPDGTYTWIMDCGDSVNDKRYTFNGHVTVMK
jgi:gliding motility-associated-like protein